MNIAIDRYAELVCGGPAACVCSGELLECCCRRDRTGRVCRDCRASLAPPDVRTCVGCGCTDDRACPGGCAWFSADVCTTCASAVRKSGGGHIPCL